MRHCSLIVQIPTKNCRPLETMLHFASFKSYPRKPFSKLLMGGEVDIDFCAFQLFWSICFRRSHLNGKKNRRRKILEGSCKRQFWGM